MAEKVPFDCRVAAEWIKRMRELDATFVSSFSDEDYFDNSYELKELLEPVYKCAKKTHDELDRYIRRRQKQVAADKFLMAALQQTKEVSPLRL